MKIFFKLVSSAAILSILFIPNTAAQTPLTIAELKTYLNNSQILLTYRKGGALYGTNYAVKIHYCSTGHYGLYGRSQKQTVLDNKQNNNWQEFGSWKVVKYKGTVGVYTKTTNAQQNFVPVYRLANGSLTIGEGSSIVRQGRAVCN